MLLKIINHKRKQPRRRSDLRRLFRYLFTPQLGAHFEGTRLLAPPELHQLFLVASPWGEEIAAAADELTAQMDAYCRTACSGRALPDCWFVHIVVAFAPSATDALHEPAFQSRTGRWGTLASNACSITRDLLDVFGWSPDRPTALVVHGDRRHVHVHVVATVPLLGTGSDWNILRISRTQLNLAAKQCATAFGLPIGRIAGGQFKFWEQLHDSPAPGVVGPEASAMR